MRTFLCLQTCFRFLIPLLFWCTSTDAFAQVKKAGVYDMMIQAQDSIYDDRQEEEIIDTLKKLTAAKIEALLQAKADFIYKVNKKGKTIGSANVFGQIGQLPYNRFKKVTKQYSRDYYIAISCRILSVGGQRVVVGNQKSLAVAPLARLKLTVYNKEKEVMYRKEVERGDFANVREEVRHRSLLRRSLSNFLFGPDKDINAEEVLYMYARTLELLN